jgi:hypothetical protein
VKRAKVCPPHAWTRATGTTVDVCLYCGIPFRDWARGFGSNVRPKRVVR